MPGMDATERCAGCQHPLPREARYCPGCGVRIAPPGATAPVNLFPPLRLVPGTQLGPNYLVEEVIGEGGMGVVYRAHDRARARTVAIKCLHTNLAGDADVRRRFAREARILRTFSHPNVVEIYDVFEQQHVVGIVMEHVDGPTLTQEIARWRGRMPFDEIGALFHQMLTAMGDAHERRIVHRDLKPDNILLARAGQRRVALPKIVDFGIARTLDGTSYTMSGQFLGTCRYMAPEQVKQPTLVDHRADVYSLGVSLYEACTGRIPFAARAHDAGPPARCRLQ